jgi:NADH dehydrogenase FAD-containing subunit
VFILIKILLVGAGESHQSILEHVKKEKTNDLEVTMISSSKSAETYKRCEEASVIFKEDTVISFDPLQKMLLSFSGEIYRFDVISFDIDTKYSLFKQALVPVDSDGRMLVEDTLQNTEFPFLFGAGECVSIYQYTKKTDSSTEQGNLLWKNIKSYINGEKLKSLNHKSSFAFSHWFDNLFKR